jgi:hypothetical protein
MVNTPETFREVFEEHLPYEMVRLVETYQLLLEPERYRSPETAETLDNALIVAFCSHARNLLEFFFRKHNTNHNYAIALDYANEAYAPLMKTGNVDKLYKQLCAQINHLTYERTAESSKKIGQRERKDLVDLIYAEAIRLGRSLKSQYDAKHLQIDCLAAAARMEVKVGAVGTSSYAKTMSLDLK